MDIRPSSFAENPSPARRATFARTLVALDTRTHRFGVINTVNDFLEEAGTITAIDYGTGAHLSVLQKLNKHTDERKDFYLVSLDISTGNLLHAAPMCDLLDDSDCPPAIGVANPVPTPASTESTIQSERRIDHDGADDPAKMVTR